MAEQHYLLPIVFQQSHAAPSLHGRLARDSCITFCTGMHDAAHRSFTLNHHPQRPVVSRVRGRFAVISREIGCASRPVFDEVKLRSGVSTSLLHRMHGILLVS